MIAERQLLTADDAWGLAADVHVEIIDGERREVAAAGGRHGGIGGRFAGHLFAYGQTTAPGEVFTSETGVIVEQSPLTLLVPDLIFVKTEHLPDGRVPVRFFETPPDLVLEILSPSQRFGELVQKAGRYLLFGVPLVWLVDPERQAITALSSDGAVRVYHSDERLDGGDVLPGFDVPVAQFFP